MININYNRLFNLRTSHTYYENGTARGVNLRPTRGTMQKIRGGKMLFKTIPAGITILYRAEADEVTPSVALPPDQVFTFSLHIENKQEFLNITDLDLSPADKYRSSSILYFTNQPGAASVDPASPEAVTHDLIDGVKNRLFTYRFTVSGSPAQVRFILSDADTNPVSPGTDAEGVPLGGEQTLNIGDDGSYEFQVDLRTKPAGRYTITILHSTDDSIQYSEEVFYVSDELASQEVFGIVDIVYESGSGHLYGDTEHYALQFSRRETIWKYVVVNKNESIDFSTEDLLIEDLGLPSAYHSPVNFTREGDEPHADVKINGLETVIFKSDSPIPFFEIPKSSVQLKKNPGNSVLVSNMPNPALGGVVKDHGSTLESEMFVFI